MKSPYQIVKRPLIMTEKGERLKEEENKVLFEVDLKATGRRAQPGDDTTLPEAVALTGAVPPDSGDEDDDRDWPPGTSPLDDAMRRLDAGLKGKNETEEEDHTDSPEGGDA